MKSGVPSPIEKNFWVFVYYILQKYYGFKYSDVVNHATVPIVKAIKSAIGEEHIGRDDCIMLVGKYFLAMKE